MEANRSNPSRVSTARVLALVRAAFDHVCFHADFFLSKLYPDRFRRDFAVRDWFDRRFCMVVPGIDHEEGPRAWVAFSIIPLVLLGYRLVRYPRGPKVIRYRPSSSTRSA